MEAWEGASALTHTKGSLWSHMVPIIRYNRVHFIYVSILTLRMLRFKQ